MAYGAHTRALSCGGARVRAPAGLKVEESLFREVVSALVFVGHVAELEDSVDVGSAVFVVFVGPEPLDTLAEFAFSFVDEAREVENLVRCIGSVRESGEAVVPGG